MHCPKCGQYQDDMTCNTFGYSVRLKCKNCASFSKVEVIPPLTFESLINRIRNNENKIQLIKELREQLDLGLNDSKSIIDLLCAITKDIRYKLEV